MADLQNNSLASSAENYAVGNIDWNKSADVIHT
jgi:hypothetical protein